MFNIKSMIALFRAKRHKKKLLAAEKLLNSQGFSILKIVRSAGSDYLVCPDGSYRKIGKSIRGLS